MSALPPARSWTARRWALAAHGLLWPVLVLFWLAIASIAVEAANAFSGWAMALVFGVCGLMALICGHLAYEALRLLRAPAPVLAVGPAGLLDLRLAAAPIPWHEIRRLSIAHFHTTRVRFELSPTGEAGVRPALRFLARLGRAIGRPGYTVGLMGLGAVDRDVAAAVKAWHDACGPDAGRA
jgi:hypothetical protein